MARSESPRPFNKPLAPAKYTKKLRDRIYLETDRSFLDSITTTDDAGFVVLSRTLEASETKRLKKLVTEARKNQGAVRTGKLIVLVSLVTAVVVFNVIFRNRLVEQGAEALLSRIFAAEADFDGIDFRPISGELSFQSLTVADRNRPMTNLFELGTGRLAVDTWQLLAGKVIVEEVTVAGLEIGTARERSGARSPAVDHGADAAAGSDLPDASGRALDDLSFASLGLPDSLDAKEFVNEQLGRLQTPQRIDALSSAGAGYAEQWREEIVSLAAAGTSSATQLRDLAATDFRSVRTVDEALRLVEETNRLVDDASGYARTVRTAANTATAEARVIIDDATLLPALVDSDYRLVRSLIPDVRADGRDFLVGLVEPYLREHLGSWYDRILTAYAYLGALRSGTDPDESVRARRRGTRIDYATVEYPAFRIDRAFASAEGARSRELILEAVSSAPDITGLPTRVTYRDRDAGESLSVGAVIDRRSDAEVTLSLNFQAEGRPVSISRGLSALDLESFAARADITVAMVRLADESTSGTVHLRTAAIVLSGAPESGSIGELVRDLLSGPDPLVASFAYAVAPDGTVTMGNGSTNLDDRISGLVQERIDATIAAFRLRVEAELDALLEPRLAALNESLAGVVDVQGAADELLALATDREAAAAALQQRALAAVDSLRGALEDEARARLDAVRAEAEAAAKEAAREQTDRATGQAEDAIRDQVEGVRDRLRLPGF